MRYLTNRTVPPGILGNITATNYREAFNSLLTVATQPIRRKRLFRVLWNGRPLWMYRNKTVYNTKASAKQDVIEWLTFTLLETVQAGRTDLGYSSYRAWDLLGTRLGFTTSDDNEPVDRQIRALVERVVQIMLETGELRIITIGLSEAAPEVEENR